MYQCDMLACADEMHTSKQGNGFERVLHHFPEMPSSLTSAVTVAFGAKPWPGLTDSTCCPVGTLDLGSKMMEAWPGRNSIQI